MRPEPCKVQGCHAHDVVHGEEDRRNKEKRREIYDRKQTALKWMLVTSFGYLGYRNARFGRIEAHEAVTAFGRESLLQAKEICEEQGFELRHYGFPLDS